jgi:hypothetical protein
MSKENHFPPEHAKGQFHCPYCAVFAKQRWSHLEAIGDSYSTNNRNQYAGKVYDSNILNLTPTTGKLPEIWTISVCEHCNNISVWNKNSMVFPKKITVEQPNPDLSEEIQADYLEAANVLNDSPRSAAAILRLALQKLCVQLGESSKSINNDIAALVKKGLNPTIQKSLDALRITGNNAVHPGELDLKEDINRVVKLFGLLNFISEKMITEPKEIGAFYDELPDEAKKAVHKRDAAKKN